jgi:hypothetical protein
MNLGTIAASVLPTGAGGIRTFGMARAGLDMTRGRAFLASFGAARANGSVSAADDLVGFRRLWYSLPHVKQFGDYYASASGLNKAAWVLDSATMGIGGVQTADTAVNLADHGGDMSGKDFISSLTNLSIGITGTGLGARGVRDYARGSRSRRASGPARDFVTDGFTGDELPGVASPMAFDVEADLHTKISFALGMTADSLDLPSVAGKVRIVSITDFEAAYVRAGGKPADAKDLNAFIVTAPDDGTGPIRVSGSEINFTGSGTPVVSGALKFVLPVPTDWGEPLVYPETVTDAAGRTHNKNDPILAWDGKPLEGDGVVVFNSSEGIDQGGVRGGQGEKRAVIIINHVTEDQAARLTMKLDELTGGHPENLTFAQFQEIEHFARTELGLSNMYDSAVGYVTANMQDPRTGLSGEYVSPFGFKKRDARHRVYMVRAGAAGELDRGEGLSPLPFATGSFILKNGNHYGVITPDDLIRTYRRADDFGPIDLATIPIWHPDASTPQRSYAGSRVNLIAVKEGSDNPQTLTHEFLHALASPAFKSVGQSRVVDLNELAPSERSEKPRLVDLSELTVRHFTLRFAGDSRLPPDTAIIRKIEKRLGDKALLRALLIPSKEDALNAFREGAKAFPEIRVDPEAPPRTLEAMTTPSHAIEPPYDDRDPGEVEIVTSMRGQDYHLIANALGDHRGSKPAGPTDSDRNLIDGWRKSGVTDPNQLDFVMRAGRRGYELKSDYTPRSEGGIMEYPLVPPVGHRSYGLYAELDVGVLSLGILKGSGAPRGSQMFDKAMLAFGWNVEAVRGIWIGGGNMSDNFDTFRTALDEGLTSEQAVFATFTGKMAWRWGFRNFTLLVHEVTDIEQRVLVEFRRSAMMQLPQRVSRRRGG